MCYQVRFITRSVTCIATMRWVMKWLGNRFRYSKKDEKTCTMRRKLCVHLWWMVIWYVTSTKECVTTDVSQFLIYPCTFLRFKGLYDLKDAVQNKLTSQAAAFYEQGKQKLCPATISASIMAANMWKNSLKNVESDNNKILYETLLDFFFTSERYLLSE